MRKNPAKGMLVAVLLFTIFFSGCGNPGEPKEAVESSSGGTMSKEGETVSKEDETMSEKGEAEDVLTLSEDVTELEDGLYAVSFEGNDGFGKFLEQGGASSDREVVKYLSGSMISGVKDMIFHGNPFGCSAFQAENGKGGFLFGRNFDWMACEAWIVSSKPETGYASISTVNMDFIGSVASKLPDSARTIAALYAPLDGMNEKGLCVSVNMIEDNAEIAQDSDKTDLTTTTVVRLLLNQAADVEEALELLQQYDLHSSMGMMVHFALADRTGKCVAVEYVDDEMAVTDSPVVTNFYLAEVEKHGIGTEQSHERYETLTKLLQEKKSFDSGAMRDALDSVGKHNFNDGATTEWSIVMDQSRNRLTYYHRENYEKAYSFEIEN